jgi:general secretion pathway protein H
MPISAPANSAAARDHGFTLIEALMALLIVGLLAGAAALSAPQPDARARAAAQALAARMVLAADESLMRNRVIGLTLSEAGYGFASLEAQGWRPFEGSAPLRYRPWPEGVTGNSLNSADSENLGVIAQFDVLGGATPARIAVHGGGGAWVVALSENGDVDVARAE